MRDGLSIRAEWLDKDDPAVAFLSMEVAGLQAFRADNLWAGSIVEKVPLSAYPLAAWFATNWWRLRWEAEPLTGVLNSGWRMAHEMAAAGEGFLWPSVSFTADGETIGVRATPTSEHSQEKFRYLASFNRTVSVEAFETGVDAFLTSTLERLAICDTGNELRELWREVLNERSDPQMARYRQIEAMVGHDPGEADEDIVLAVMGLEARAGVAAASEIAALCSYYTLDSVMTVAAQPGVVGRISVPGGLKEGPARGSVGAASAILHTPAIEGRAKADKVRASLGLDALSRVTDGALADLLELREKELLDLDGLRKGPLALIVSEPQRDRIIFRKRRYASGRRFEAARMICDKMMRPEDHWHPITETQTARQKIQRAFAAELLAPIAGVKAYLDDDFSTDAIEGAAERFDVSTHTIASQLANHGVIPRWHPAVPDLHA